MTTYIVSVICSILVLTYMFYEASKTEDFPQEISVMTILMFGFLVFTPIINSLFGFIAGIPILISFLSDIRIKLPKRNQK